MFRILLAQNNKKNVNVIKSALLEKASDIEYIEVAANVNDIVNSVELVKPDMLFVSYELNAGNCFWVMKELAEKRIFGEESQNDKKLYIVVTTLCDNYEVIRTAFKLGAQDCIVEPLNRKIIVDVVENIMEKTLSDKIKHFQKEVLERKSVEYDVLAEHTFFYNVMFNEEFDKIILNLRDFKYWEENGFIITFEIMNMIDYEYFDHNEFQKEFRSKLQRIMNLKMGPVINGRLCVYIKCDDSYLRDKVKMNNLLYWTGKEISDFMMSELSLKVRAGVGGVYSIKNICKSYEESLRALSVSENVVVYKEKNEKCKRDFQLYKGAFVKFMESIEMGSEECFDNFSKVLDTISDWDDEEKYNRILLILTVVTCTIKKHSLYEDNIGLCIEEFKKNFALKQGDINTSAIKRFSNLIKNEESYKLKEYSEYVKFCVEHIHNHYKEEIVLKEVADMCGVSVQYLSKLFREETGMNFVGFLNDYKIKKAMKLMKQSKSSIKEICFEVGYNDPNYFSRIFKKNTGKTPREYINEFVNHINNID